MRRALAAGLADVDEEEEDWDADENVLDDDFVMQAAGVGEVSVALPCIIRAAMPWFLRIWLSAGGAGEGGRGG